MVAAVVVMLVASVAGAVAGVPNLCEVCHGGGFLLVDLLEESGVDCPAVMAHPAPVNAEGVRQEALVACYDVGQVPQAPRGVAFGADVDVDPASPGGVAFGPSLPQPPHQLLESVHVIVGEDWGNQLALFAVRPVDADILLEFPFAALGIPGRPGEVTIAAGCILVTPGAEELGGQLGGVPAGDAVHLDLDPYGLLFHLRNLVHQLLVHGVDLRFLSVPGGVFFPFGSDIFALKRRNSKLFRGIRYTKIGLVFWCIYTGFFLPRVRQSMRCRPTGPPRENHQTGCPA